MHLSYQTLFGLLAFMMAHIQAKSISERLQYAVDEIKSAEEMKNSLETLIKEEKNVLNEMMDVKMESVADCLEKLKSNGKAHVAEINQCYGLTSDLRQFQPNANPAYKRAAIAQWKWPTVNGVLKVPYDITGAFSTDEIGIISSAISILNGVLSSCNSNVFIPRTTEADYLNFNNAEGGCWSWLGRQGGAQTINLASGCFNGNPNTGTTIHEILHALGFGHEQSRKDRDSYVTIVTANIQSNSVDQFDKISFTSDFCTPYDFRSVMHYSDTAFSQNGLKTILAVDPANQGLMGQDSLSSWDQTQLKRMYGCEATPDCSPTTTTTTTTTTTPSTTTTATTTTTTPTTTTTASTATTTTTTPTTTTTTTIPTTTTTTTRTTPAPPPLPVVTPDPLTSITLDKCSVMSYDNLAATSTTTYASRNLNVINVISGDEPIRMQPRRKRRSSSVNLSSIKNKRVLEARRRMKRNTCVDTGTNCHLFVSNPTYCTTLSTLANSKCQATCGICGTTTTTTPTTTTTTTTTTTAAPGVTTTTIAPTGACQDIGKICYLVNSIANFCTFSVAKTNCPSTCNTCSTITTTVTPSATTAPTGAPAGQSTYLRLSTSEGSLVSAVAPRAAVTAALSCTCDINWGNGDYFVKCARQNYCVRSLVRRQSTVTSSDNTDTVVIQRFQHNYGTYSVHWAYDSLPASQWVELNMDVPGYCDEFNVQHYLHAATTDILDIAGVYVDNKKCAETCTAARRESSFKFMNRDNKYNRFYRELEAIEKDLDNAENRIRQGHFSEHKMKMN